VAQWSIQLQAPASASHQHSTSGSIRSVTYAAVAAWAGLRIVHERLATVVDTLLVGFELGWTAHRNDHSQ
jgi:hypothetical protein